MFNRVVLLGNLTRDIELRYLPSGSAVATTGIATNRRFKKQDGSQGEEVMFIDITFFGRSAEIANQYLSRGKKLLIEGRLKLDSWTDNQGAKRSKHSIHVETMQMIDSRQSEEQPQRNAPKVETYDSQGNKTAEYDFPTIEINPDEIPF